MEASGTDPIEGQRSIPEDNRGEVRRVHRPGAEQQPEPRHATLGGPDDGHARDHVAASDPTPAEEIANRDWKLRFRLGVARRYNARLAATYQALDRLSVAASLVGGSAIVTDALGGVSGGAVIAGVVVVVSSALSLVFGWSDKARQYAGLYRQYTMLFERLVRASSALTPTALDGFDADLTLIEADEPAVRDALMVLCHNAEANAHGLGSDHKQSLWFWQRWAAPLVTLPPRPWE